MADRRAPQLPAAMGLTALIGSAMALTALTPSTGFAMCTQVGVISPALCLAILGTIGCLGTSGTKGKLVRLPLK